MKNNTMIPVAVVFAIVVGVGAFFGGMKYQQSQTPQFGRQQGAGGAGNFGSGQRNRAGGGAGRPVIGEVISQDDTSITVKLQDGSSKIVLLPGTVTVSKTDTGTKADVKVGSKVGVFGTDNADGSVTAQNVQLNPMFRGMQGGGVATPAAK